MSSPFLGQLKLFAFNYAPKGWALCSGQLLAIQQNAALFSLLGTTYGGNGTTTFGLPDLRSRVPIHWGTSLAGTSYVLGQIAGEENVTLTVAQMPSHTHPVEVSGHEGNAVSPPAAGSLGASPRTYGEGSPTVTMNAAASTSAGSSQAHTNLQPYLALNYCIALSGLFPPRS